MNAELIFLTFVVHAALRESTKSHVNVSNILEYLALHTKPHKRWVWWSFSAELITGYSPLMAQILWQTAQAKSGSSQFLSWWASGWLCKRVTGCLTSHDQTDMKRPLTWSDLHTPTHTDRYTDEPTFSSPWQVKLTHTPIPLVMLLFCTRTCWSNVFTCTTIHPGQNLSIWSSTSPISTSKIGGVIMKNTTVRHCLMLDQRQLDETKGCFFVCRFIYRHVALKGKLFELFLAYPVYTSK